MYHCTLKKNTRYKVSFQNSRIQFLLCIQFRVYLMDTLGRKPRVTSLMKVSNNRNYFFRPT